MKHRKGKGQSLVEFALALPLLVLLLMGLLDFGRAYFIIVMLNDAAAEGAIYAGSNPSDVNGIRNRVVESAADVLIQITPQDVTVVHSGIAPGASITVTATFEFTFLTPFISNLFGNSLTLRGQAVNPIM